jgi:diguanylate cyclase (GGDEF)-like protein
MMRWHLRQYAAAYAVLAIMLGVTLAAWYAAVGYVDMQAERRFADAVHITRLAIERRIEVYVNALYGVGALFYHSERVTRREFQDYVAHLDLPRQYPGMHSVSYVRHLAPGQAGVLVEQLRRELHNDPCGYPPLPELAAAGRGEHYLVVFIEPIAHNTALFGQDRAADPVCREAMERARDTGTVAATARQVFRHGGRDKPGVTLLLPIYAPRATLATAAERRRALTGFVSAALLGPDLLPGIFGNPVDPGIDFEIFDGTEPSADNLLYDDDQVLHALEGGAQARHRQLVALEVGGRRWGAYFSTRPQFEAELNYRFAWVVLIGGLLVSALLFRITAVQARLSAERQAQAHALARQATHDSLTGLGNRELLASHMQAAFAGGEPRALALIDLDGFKEINDTLGHHAGDQLLRQLGPRLTRALVPADTLARLGGDEFAAWLAPPTDAAAAQARARALLEAVRSPFDIEGITLHVDASIGVALYPEHGSSVGTLLRCADVAMYVAKRERSGYALYDPQRDSHSPQRLALLSDLRAALESDQLLLHFQPIVKLKGRRVAAVEALARWMHPREGLLAAGSFVPQVEASTLIRPFTEWVIDRALYYWRQTGSAGHQCGVSINVSARNLLDREFPETLDAALRRHGAEPARVELEITESALITDPERVRATLARVREIGVRLAVDDFGTGYSSLDYLRRLPISTLKIDRSFVHGMVADENQAVIVHSTINLAHNLGLRVVAEGVEDQETAELLELLDCDCAQGYFLSRPQPAAALAEWCTAA